MFAGTIILSAELTLCPTSIQTRQALQRQALQQHLNAASAHTQPSGAPRRNKCCS